MLRPDAILAAHRAAIARETERIASHTNARPAQGREFAAMFGAIRAEISQFIAAGGAGRQPSLNFEGAALRARLVRNAAADRHDAAQGSPKPHPGATRAQQEAFIASIAPYARAAAAQLGVSAHLLAAHAALESGWGQRPLRGSDGANTHNIFGVKAGAGWSGESAVALTTEFDGDVPVQTRETFRSYPDLASAFRDYTRLLSNDPRYSDALDVGDDARAFAQALARGRYATDPAYAHKLERLARQLRELDTPLKPADGLKESH
jgi:flagellar protein FlgJ